MVKARPRVVSRLSGSSRFTVRISPTGHGRECDALHGVATGAEADAQQVRSLGGSLSYMRGGFGQVTGSFELALRGARLGFVQGWRACVLVLAGGAARMCRSCLLVGIIVPCDLKCVSPAPLKSVSSGSQMVSGLPPMSTRAAAAQSGTTTAALSDESSHSPGEYPMEHRTHRERLGHTSRSRSSLHGIANAHPSSPRFRALGRRRVACASSLADCCSHRAVAPCALGRADHRRQAAHVKHDK